MCHFGAVPKVNNRKPKIRQRKNKRVTSWEVDCGFIDGKRHRKSFQTKGDATSYSNTVAIKIQNEGTSALSLSQATRIDAMEASKILAPFEVSLKDAANYYAVSHSAFLKVPNIEKIAEEYLKNAKRNGRRERTLLDLKSRLKAFTEDFGENKPHEVLQEDIEEWLHENDDWKPRTILNYRAKVSQLFNFAIRRNWTDRNPVNGIDKPSVEDPDPEIYTISETRKLLQHSTEFDLLAFISLGLFAGIRTAERHRLEWKDIMHSENCIRIGASIAKKRSQRNIAIQPCLSSWLDLVKKGEGKVVVKKNFKPRMKSLREKCGIETWKHNGLRHSFGSYHLERFGDEIETSKEMGNDKEMLHKHYKALVSSKDAKAYWELTPKKVLPKGAA
jgi:integrase